jgi:hypothetical protein
MDTIGLFAETVCSLVGETVYYVLVGGIATATVFVAGCLLASPFLFLLEQGQALDLARRVTIFATMLFFFGAPAHLVFASLLGAPADEELLWLPWLPVGWMMHADEYLGSAGPWAVRMTWLGLALPVWGATIVAFRRWAPDEWEGRV